MKRLIGIIFFLAALDGRAAATIRVDPPNPDSISTLTFWIGGTWPNFCSPSSPSVSVDGTEVTITMIDGSCLAQEIQWSESVRAAALPAGNYHVRAIAVDEFPPKPSTHPPILIAETTLAVADANAPFTIVPNVSSISGGPIVDLTANTRIAVCTNGFDCLAPRVTFGDVRAATKAISSSQVKAAVPAHSAGAVTVTSNGVSAVNVFRYFDPNAPADDAVFEPILIPLMFNGPGAFGSRWTTDLWVRNDNAQAVTSYRPLVYTDCGLIAPCPTLIDARASAHVQPTPELPGSGAIFRVSRQQSSSLSFAARIRDTSRSGEGAELPIVRERDFRRGHIVLPGVTVEPGSRTTLRLYSIDEIPSFKIELSGEGINPIFTGTSFAGGATVAATKATGDAPWIATIDVASVIQRRYLDGDFGPFRIDITARPPFSRIWAMVSITNNDTQRVTIVSPH